MRWIDELHLQYPLAGARMLRNVLRREGYGVGRHHVVSLMRRMGITAVYRKPAPTNGIRPTGATPICCTSWPSRARTRCGQPISPLEF